MDVSDIMEFEDIIDDEIDEDDFIDLAINVAFPRRAKVFRERPDHFQVWRDDEFLHRFRLKKDTVKFILNMVETRFTSPTNRSVSKYLLFIFTIIIH